MAILVLLRLRVYLDPVCPILHGLDLGQGSSTICPGARRRRRRNHARPCQPGPRTSAPWVARARPRRRSRPSIITYRCIRYYHRYISNEHCRSNYHGPIILVLDYINLTQPPTIDITKIGVTTLVLAPFRCRRSTHILVSPKYTHFGDLPGAFTWYRYRVHVPAFLSRPGESISSVPVYARYAALYIFLF